MTNSDAAREAARRGNGEFGVHARPESEVDLDAVAEPKTWSLTVRYAAGDIETIVFDDEGYLPAPHRSDSLFLYRLVGFRVWNSDKILPVALAISKERDELGAPVFETTDGGTTGLRAEILSFVPTRP